MTSFITLTFCLGGCAGIHYTDSVQAVNLSQASGPKTTTKVMAEASDWRNSGVLLKKGSAYTIKASGRWSAGAICGWTGPDGFGITFTCSGAGTYSGSDNASVLLGKIGEEGKPFIVGSGLELIAPEEGILFFRINDTPLFTGDNNGFVEVSIALHDAGEAVAASPANREEQPQRTPSRQMAPLAVQKWAVVIGISNYQDSRIAGLRYASSDARSFYELLVSPQAGGYAPSRVKLLLDTDATSQNIRNALFSWLKQALAEDLVTIYFAGHGSPESPDAPNNLYLLPFDARYDDITTSGFPMWDIETALKRFIKAKKVVVIADACHSGGVGQSFDIARRGDRGVAVNPISASLQNLSQVGDGIAVLSASDDKQLSQEGQQWGGGHGVFTFYLLKGMGGDADYNKDGQVTLGELIPYLSERVRRETGNAQSPTVAGKFDPALSIGQQGH